MYSTNRLDINSLLNHIISITDLGRGKATQVLNTIIKEKVPYIIFKNNKPRAALVDIDVYSDLIETKKKYMEMMEEDFLLKIAEDRISKHDPSKTVEFEDVIRKYGISAEDLDAADDEVEIE